MDGYNKMEVSDGGCFDPDFTPGFSEIHDFCDSAQLVNVGTPQTDFTLFKRSNAQSEDVRPS